MRFVGFTFFIFIFSKEVFGTEVRRGCKTFLFSKNKINLSKLFLLFLFLNCFDNLPTNPFQKKEKKNVLESYLEGGGIGLCLASASSRSVLEVEDNRDGYIRVITNIYGTQPACPWQWGRGESKIGFSGTPLVLYKCLMGQVYRKEQNDCKGTGTASNFYGAQKLQLCVDSDSSCIISSNNNPDRININKSPALTSCSQIGSSQLLQEKELSTLILNYLEGIPNAENDFYWEVSLYKDVNNPNLYKTFINNYSLRLKSAFLNEFHYVICKK